MRQFSADQCPANVSTCRSTMVLALAVFLAFWSIVVQPAAAQTGLVEFSKPKLGFTLLVPQHFTSLEKIEGNDSIFTFSGFNGRASIQIRTATLKKPITPGELGAVYQKKVLSEAIEITGGSWINVSGVQSLRKVYTLTEQAAPDKPLEKVIVTVLYSIANDRFYVFQISNLEMLDWPERTTVIESFDLFSSNDRNYPAAAVSGTLGSAFQAGNIAPLTVNSRPEGAKIFLNGAYAGNTPLTVKTDRVGSYEVNLSLNGYRPWTRTIQVNFDTVAMVDAFLDPVDSEVFSEPDATSYQDEKRVYSYTGSRVPVPDRKENFDQSGATAAGSRTSYDYVNAVATSSNPSRSLETRLPDNLHRFEKAYVELEEETRYFEEKVFHQRRPIQLDRKLAKRLKKLDQSVKSASREIVETYGERSGASELINRFSALQTKVRQMVILSR